MIAHLFYFKVSTCVDFPGFTILHDEDGTSCNKTMKEEDCKDGKPNREGLEQYHDSQGYSVLDACCGCGGGIKG